MRHLLRPLPLGLVGLLVVGAVGVAAIGDDDTSRPAPIELVTVDDDGVREEDLPAELRVDRGDSDDDLDPDDTGGDGPAVADVSDDTQPATTSRADDVSDDAGSTPATADDDSDDGPSSTESADVSDDTEAAPAEPPDDDSDDSADDSDDGDDDSDD